MRDSSLSACTQAVIAAEVGHLELAYDYFAEAALIDLADLEHNTSDGLHIASLAGAWIAVGAGFGGMRDHEGRLSFAPRLPPALTRLVVPARVPRAPPRRSRCAASRRRTRCTEGDPLEITHHGDRITLEPDEPLTLKVPPAPHRPEPTQPPGREPMRRRFGPT